MYDSHGLLSILTQNGSHNYFETGSRAALLLTFWILVGRVGFEPTAFRLKGEYTSIGVTVPNW